MAPPAMMSTDLGRSARLALAAAGAVLVVATAGAAARSTLDGVYTDQQAKQGKKLFEQHCMMCHDRNYFQPVLRAWEGQPVGLLYETLIATMPETNPGGLLDREYESIVAYIFSRSSYPTGEEALRGGRSLHEIVIANP
ncbi:MAG: cytochrome c [Pseudomonadales bacterium]